MSRIHKLKTLTPYFENVRDGKKLAEVRLNDRDFQAGDILELHRFDGTAYVCDPISGRVNTEKRLITHVLFGVPGLAPGYCVLSLGKVTE